MKEVRNEKTGHTMSVSENTAKEILTMIEIRNEKTGRVRLVPAATAEAVRKQKHFIKQGWIVIERSEPPYEVLQFQESKQVVKPPIAPIEQPTPIETPVVSVTEPGLKITSVDPTAAPFDSQKLTVKRIAQRLNDFTHDELLVLAADPRKSVVELANRKLNG